MTISKLSSDQSVLSEIGQRIARRRLDLQYTQADLAEQAGLAKRTVERIEAGGSAQMSSLIRIFRVLDLLSGLDQMIPKVGPGPMDLLKRKGRLRQRASSRRPSDRSDQPWTWDDES
jgi:transcriptional regulator with XRE-family HTH domain